MVRGLLTAVVTAMVLSGAALGCQAEEEFVPPEQRDVVIVSEYTPAPTATPWPTFTPGPTNTPLPTATPSPTATPRPTQPLPRVVRPTATPLPTLVIELGGTPEPTEAPIVLPTPYARVWGTDVHLKRRSVYASQVGRIADYIVDGNFEKLPENQTEMSKTTRYVMWIAVFDVDSAPESFEMTGVERWLDITRGDADPLVMYQRHYTISKDSWVVNSGLGDDLPGAWKSGSYRVELWDDRDEVLAQWNFRIK